MDEEFALTTFDNPFNPLTHFKEWYAFDTALGHHTSSLMALLSFESKELPESVRIQLNNRVIDDVIAGDSLGIYRKITRNETPIVIEG